MTLTDVNSRQPQELLYHYTSVESFVSIINGGELWASHVRCLNDTSEQRLIWDHVRARIKTRLDEADEGDRNRLLLFQSLASSPVELDIYVLCFSKDGGDRLSQWRGYGGSGGVAIGFDSGELKRRCSVFTTAKSQNRPFPMGFALLNPVHYIQPTGDERSSQIIDIFIDNPNATVHEGRFTQEEVFARRVSLSSSSLKHNAFHEENEWRIAIFDLPEDSIRFRTRKSMVVPYAQFDLGRGGPSWPLIPRVIVGPSPHQAETIAAIRRMLDDQTDIVGSSIPYRDW
jgi:Protein of unknown function (DUF2971)